MPMEYQERSQPDPNKPGSYFSSLSEAIQLPAAIREEIAYQAIQNTLTDPRVPWNLLEYNCTYRSEMIISTLLDLCVPAIAIRRVTSLNDDLSQETISNAYQRLEDGSLLSSSPKVSKFFSHADPFMAMMLPKMQKYIPASDQIANELTYDGVTIKFLSENRVNVGGKDYNFHLADKVIWSIGHITAGVIVETNEGAELRVIDPTLSPNNLLTADEWLKLQNNPKGYLLASALGEKPALVPEVLGDLQKETVLSLLNTQLSRKEKAEDSLSPAEQATVIRQKLAELSEEGRAAFYNSLFQCADSFPYKNWDGWRISGPLEGKDGTIVPDFPDGKQTREVAIEGFLAPFVTFQKFLHEVLEDEMFEFRSVRI